jgi:hypothetical protein
MLKILINGFNTFFIRRFCINIYTSWAFFFSMLSFWICLLACSIFLLLLRTVHLMGPEHLSRSISKSDRAYIDMQELGGEDFNPKERVHTQQR